MPPPDSGVAKLVSALPPTGEALPRFADEDEARRLRPGDWLDIAARRRHRVE